MAWYHTDWGYRVKVTSQNAKVFEDVTNWVYYIPLSDLPAGFWSNVDTNGEDVRVTTTDGQTECAIALSSFDGVGDTGALFWKHNSSSTGDVDYYIYYGASGKSLYADSATYGRYNCFNSLWNWMYFLDEDPATAGSGGIKNSVQNSEHGTPDGTWTSDVVSGKLEKDAINFDVADNDHIRLGNSDHDLTTPFTLICWAITDVTGSSTQFDAKYDRNGGFNTSNRNWLWAFRGTDQLRIQKATTGGTFHQYDSPATQRSAGDFGVWRMWAVTCDSAATTVVHYKDNASAGSGSLTNNSIRANAFRPTIASVYDNAASSESIWEWDGSIDTIGNANSAWSLNRIKTWYEQTGDPTNFWSVGTQEAQPASTFKPQVVINI